MALTTRYLSGRLDLNQRPPDPQSGALTRLRHAPIFVFQIADMGTLGGFPNSPAMVRRRQSRRLPPRLFFHESYQIQEPLLHLSHGLDVDFRRRHRRRRALVVTQFPQACARPLDGEALPV
jgi:hypothetical protein